MELAYVEGRFIPYEEASIPISDRGFLFGDGAFSTIQVRDGFPLFLQTHLDQLRAQCAAFNLIMPPISQSLIEELIDRNQAGEGVWRLKIVVTGGDTPEIALPTRKGRLVILIKPFQPSVHPPLKLGIFPIPFYLCHASYKSLAHLNRFYVMQEAKVQEVDDCVTLTEQGIILEAAFGNLFWVKAKTLYTPDPKLPLYFGVTIKNILKIALTLGYQVEFIKAPLDAIPEGASCFRVNTMQGIRAVAQIGTSLFSVNTVVERVFLNGYEDLIEAEKQQCLGHRCYTQTT